MGLSNGRKQKKLSLTEGELIGGWVVFRDEFKQGNASRAFKEIKGPGSKKGRTRSMESMRMAKTRKKKRMKVVDELDRNIGGSFCESPQRPP